MDSQDVAKIGHKAKRETEAFINNYFNDQAKGWPRLSNCGLVPIGYHQKQHIKRRDRRQILLTR